MFRFAVCWILTTALWVTVSAGESVIRNADRGTDKLVLAPQTALSVKNEAGARAYLRADAARFGLPEDLDGLVLDRVKKSLTGTHYHFRQTVQGHPVDGAGIVVSVDDEGLVAKVHNTTWPVPETVRAKSTIQLDEADALHVSWDELRVHGDLLAEPFTERRWRVMDGEFQLVWYVELFTSRPNGLWAVTTDAVNGQVIDVVNRTLDRRGEQEPHRAYEGSTNDLEVELERFRARDEARRTYQKSLRKDGINGQGMVFDPDPRTTLMNEDLLDNSPESAFTDAYQLRDLRDISQDNQNNYVLSGPWAHLTDYESPNTPPSTTTDGFWNFTRGNNGLNDAITYYHVDKNQRYIQSLGFTGERGIQNGPIDIDSDALDGFDQSVYYSGTNINVLAFGHGCVDDSEDADVIIHEYGHAIQQWIVPGWFFSGDEGGMGEGFSDFWAASHRFKTPNGPIYYPNHMFHWDGSHIGTFQYCWPGRRLDKVQAVYNPNQSYGAHELYFDGTYEFESDELWSTPLWQSFLNLYSQGIPQTEIDQIVLESHFGLESPLTMPEVATSTVNAARMLFPDGPHATVFQNNFARHNIIGEVEGYDYHSIHISPSTPTSGWVNEVVIHNPNDEPATVVATVYEGDTDSIGLANYTMLSQDQLVIDPGATEAFSPGGTLQRWIHFNSDLPLAGTTVVQRDGSDQGLGIEKATIPLLTETEVSNTVVFPHVPADRATFWSGAVLLNPNGNEVSLTYELIGDQGSDLSGLLSQGAPATLDANQKLVTLLAGGLFDDSGSEEKVSWVRVTSNEGEIAGFQLYGYNAAQGQVATSGIISQADQSRSFWPIRASLTDSDFNGFSILNPTASDAAATVRLVFTDGSMSDPADLTIQALSKKLGVNRADFFRFPSNEANLLFDLNDGTDIQAILVESEAPLRIFELVGDFDGSTLDGAAVTGVTNHVVFPNATGTLEVLRVGYEGEVTVTFNGTAQTETRTMQAGESWQAVIPEGTTSVEVSGALFQATVIERSNEDRYLATINGKEIAFHP